jgi:hypothetical protein
MCCAFHVPETVVGCMLAPHDASTVDSVRWRARVELLALLCASERVAKAK